MRLYDIAKNIEDVIELGMVVDKETGEILFDSSHFEGLVISFNDKLESCGIYIKNLRAEIEAIKAEENGLRDRRKSIERKAANMEEYVLSCLTITETNRFSTPKVALSTRKSSQVIITNDRLISDEYIKVKEEKTVDKTAIKNAIKSGVDVQGAAIQENINLVIR